MVANLLPGLREIRAPLISGYIWLVFFFLAFNDSLPHRDDPETVLGPLFELGDRLSPFGLAAVSGVAAYLTGSAVQEMLKLLGRLGLFERPLYGEAGTHMSAAGRADIHDFVEIQVQRVRRKLFQVALLPGEKGVDEEPKPGRVERELPLIRTLLLGERPELVRELDRLQSEADLRITVAFPLAAFAVFLAFESSFWWLCGVAPVGLLIAQGFQRQREAGDLLAKALRIGKASAPALESLEASADDALERVDLEENLSRKVDEENALAAFRLGNLQASSESFDGALLSLKFAAEKGVVQAYAEMGIVYEKLNDPENAEQAYRDGDQRNDRKAGERLAAFLEVQKRNEEALETAKRARDGDHGDDGEPDARAVPRERSRMAGYRRRMDEDRDGKAALNLGLLLRRRGDLEGAAEAFGKATQFDDDDAQAWENLGFAEEELVRPEGARAAQERALEIRERKLGPDHLSIAATLSNLGNAYYVLGDYTRAKRLYERALEIEKRELGPDSLEAAKTLGNLANTVGDLGDSRLARDLHEEVLSTKEGLVSPDNISIGITLGNLGCEYFKLGEYGRARDLHKRALAVRENASRPVPFLVGTALVNLGDAESGLDEHQRARELLERALGIFEGILGKDHFEVASTLASLGAALRAGGEVDESGRVLRRAREIAEAAPYRNELRFAEILREFAKTMDALGAYPEARDAIERAVEIQRQHLAPSHPELAKTLDTSAVILRGQEEPAEDARARAAEIRREHRLE